MQDGHGRSYSSVSGETKEGTWKCNQPVEGKHAEWVILYPNNDKFVGTTQSGRPWGQGILTSGSSDFIYDGDWCQDTRTGKGTCVIRGAETYTGDWEENRFHGMGMYTAADGSVFEGEFVHGIKQGMGKLSTADNHVYHGEFVHGERCGVGMENLVDTTYVYPLNGERYVGQWANNVRQGKVHFESHEMIEKMVLGYGCHMDAKGTTKDGAWRGDLPVDGDWHIQFASGSSYNGECVGGKPHGHGVCKYTNGDARSGWGVCVFANGHVFQGEWTANHVSLNGKGTLTMANGTVHAYAQ
ncbi:hypothetical protein DYB37_005735 [Aphanomyces astaci]|uniref:MORN repeat-containing protein 5 n=1 Tax=Aphanomyces astaci TaxID=112090 RepID=A0A3R7BEB7_APHAT|nr:hypothetical protein DYB35_001283 [Aphanomyces astaci]RHZ18742.1 hypothetical protein DYB37_005735 [Aphanomyces astaci]